MLQNTNIGLKTLKIGLKTHKIGLKTHKIGLKTLKIGLKTPKIGLKTLKIGIIFSVYPEDMIFPVPRMSVNHFSLGTGNIISLHFRM